MRQLLELQDKLHALGMSDKKEDKRALAARATAWRGLEDMKRIILGKPNPGVLKPDQPARPKGKSPAIPVSFTPPVVVSDTPSGSGVAAAS